MTVTRKNTPDRARVKILTVHPDTRRIEGGLRDGGVVQISVIGTGPLFRWPMVGESWTILRRNQAWLLDQLVEFGELDKPVEDMEPGETKLYSDVIYDNSGKQLATIDDITTGTGTVNKYAATIGDGVSTTYDVPHSLATTDVDADFYLLTSGESIETDWQVVDASKIRVTTQVPPLLNSLRVTVWG